METGTIAGSTKWSIAVSALDQVVAQFENDIEMGLMLFPEPNECNPGSVYVQPATGNHSAIMTELASPPPTGGNWTPMAQTLQVAATEPSLNDPNVPRYAVLITDGWQWCSPYDPTTRFDPVNAVVDLNAAGVKTYVVGFGDSVDALVLNQVAVTAGTARAGCDPTGDSPMAANPCYYQADDPSELADALQQIAGSVSTEVCDGLDNDCDGMVDEGLTQACSTDCGSGTETCQNGNWVGCDAPQPEPEVCDGVDNDCDGTTDPGCDCIPGDTRECGAQDACQNGTQTCTSGGSWGNCEGVVTPGNEMCDGLDNDCDGQTDEMNDDAVGLCGPGFVCENGDCDPVNPPTPPGDDGPGADGDGTPSGCACNVATDGESAAGGLLLMLGVALALRRRRR